VILVNFAKIVLAAIAITMPWLPDRGGDRLRKSPGPLAHRFCEDDRGDDRKEAEAHTGHRRDLLEYG